MALSDSGRAIGAVTRLLREYLMRRGLNVTVGKPEAAEDAADKLNLFLYACCIEGHLRNVALQPDRPAPIWLTLRYLLTALDAAESSESTAAQELLGRGIAALQELNFLGLDAAVEADVRLALQDNPEALTLTFDEASPDLISKVMTGEDETYRLSMAFQVRPVMIMPSQAEPFAGVVGVDVTATPATIIGRAGIGIAVLASLGPRLARLHPPAFDPGETLTLDGDDLHLSGLEALLGGVPIAITAQRTDRITLVAEGPAPAGAEGPIADGATLSAGEHALTLRQALPNGRFRSSNLLLARLRPVVASAAVDGTGRLTVNGLLLGRWEDDILVALQRDGAPPRSFEVGLPPPPAPAARSVVPGAGQKTLTVGGLTGAVPAGEWRVVVRVNGQQARATPAVTVAP